MHGTLRVNTFKAFNEVLQYGEKKMLNPVFLLLGILRTSLEANWLINPLTPGLWCPLKGHIYLNKFAAFSRLTF